MRFLISCAFRIAKEYLRGWFVELNLPFPGTCTDMQLLYLSVCLSVCLSVS